jgi:hypothetical protein
MASSSHDSPGEKLRGAVLPKLVLMLSSAGAKRSPDAQNEWGLRSLTGFCHGRLLSPPVRVDEVAALKYAPDESREIFFVKVFSRLRDRLHFQLEKPTLFASCPKACPAILPE